MTLDISAWRRSSRATARTSRAGGTHFPCFDGLRALAALTVVGVHTTFVSGLTTRHPGWGRYTSRLEIGVEVFFVISGFLLYRPFAVAHFGGRPAPTMKRFWIKRLKRIIPAYWLAFIIATYILRADSGGGGWKGPLVFLGFAQIYFPQYVLHGLSQAWSLCTEMTFYLMIPFYAVALGRRTRSLQEQLRIEVIGLAILTGISFAYRIPVVAAAYRVQQKVSLASLTHSNHGYLVQVMPNWLPGYLDEFALGMFLAVASAYLAARESRPSWLWHPAMPWVCWAGAAFCYWAVANIGLPLLPVTPSPVGASLARQTLYGLFAFLLVAPAVFGAQERGMVRSVLKWRALALIGIASYGVYLWHESWIHMYLVWTGDHEFNISWIHLTLAAAGLAIAAAALSYRLVERPILRSGRAAGAGREPGILHRVMGESRVASLIGARS